MKDHSDTSNLITTKNIFSINRLGISDSFESGKSITLGLDYRREKEFDINKYIEVKFAGILRDTPNYKIPKSSSSQGQTSNLFGSVENRFSENFKLDYNFSLDNNFENFEQNEIIAEFGVNNLSQNLNSMKPMEKLEIQTLLKIRQLLILMKIIV